jgi:hypothetical protein
VETAGFDGAKRISATAGIKTSVPERFAGVDIADAGDAGLIEQEVLEGTP